MHNNNIKMFRSRLFFLNINGWQMVTGIVLSLKAVQLELLESTKVQSWYKEFTYYITEDAEQGHSNCWQHQGKESWTQFDGCCIVEDHFCHLLMKKNKKLVMQYAILSWNFLYTPPRSLSLICSIETNDELCQEISKWHLCLLLVLHVDHAQ